ncbi:MAG: MBL fold metallo-hydrolase [Kofleriaceae bacterium]|nr:MBL fold metallo-hydrolase [Kofleriaceae bacterium]
MSPEGARVVSPAAPKSRYTVGVLLRETFPAGPLECNCTILACGDTKDAVVIDPGGELEHIAEIVAHYDLTVRSIIHTHAHLDHIYGTRDVKEAHGGAICLHKGDTFLYDGFAMQASMFGWKVRDVLPVERWIEHGDTIQLGKRELSVIHTPGHTPGSVCFEIHDPDAGRLMFAGDTLFKRSVGRSDLPGGDGKQLVTSIRERLYTRDLDTLVIPGHGPTTTLGDEARANPFVRA